MHVHAKTALLETEATRDIGMSPAWLKQSRARRVRHVSDAPPCVGASIKRIVYRLDLNAWLPGEVAEAAERDSPANILSKCPGISGHASTYSAGHGGQP
jgi:hypothetical protein